MAAIRMRYSDLRARSNQTPSGQGRLVRPPPYLTTPTGARRHRGLSSVVAQRGRLCETNLMTLVVPHCRSPGPLLRNEPTDTHCRSLSLIVASCPFACSITLYIHYTWAAPSLSGYVRVQSGQ